MTTVYTNLRDANIARQKEYEASRKPTTSLGIADLSFRAMEMAGEVGEVLDAVSQGMRPEGVKVPNECADVIITADLAALEAGLPRFDFPTSMVKCRELAPMCLAMAHTSGLACNDMKKMARSRMGYVGSAHDPERLRLNLGATIISAFNLIDMYGYTPRAVIEDVFNRRSEELGFDTRLRLHENGDVVTPDSRFFGDEDMDPEARLARASTFDLLDAMVTDLTDEGYTDQANQLSAAYSRGTGAIDVDVVVDVFTTIFTEHVDTSPASESLMKRDPLLEEVKRMFPGMEVVGLDLSRGLSDKDLRDAITRFSEALKRTPPRTR